MAYLKEKLELKLGEAELEAESMLHRYPPFFRYIIVGAIILLIPAYFIAKAVSRGYWNAKYKTDVITAKRSFGAAEMPAIENVLLVPNGNGNYSAAALVSNPNLELSLNDGTVEFQFYSADDERLDAVRQKFFLLPGQKKWLVVPRVDALQALARATVNFPETLPWQKRLSIPGLRLTTTSPRVSIQSAPLATTARGSVTNNSPYLVRRVNLYFLLYSASGRLISISRRTESDIQAFETRDYVHNWPGISLPDARVEVEVETNTLDPGNLQLQDIDTPSADLSRPNKND